MNEEAGVGRERGSVCKPADLQIAALKAVELESAQISLKQAGHGGIAASDHANFTQDVC